MLTLKLTVVLLEILTAEVRQQSIVFLNNNAIVVNDRLTTLSQNAHTNTCVQSLTTQKCITSAHTITTKHTDHPHAHLVSKTRSLTLQTHSLTHTYTLENPDRKHLE